LENEALTIQEHEDRRREEEILGVEEIEGED
jgi:hypothetical protein